MNAKLVLKNVGGLRGVHVFNFNSGLINLVRAPNAAGKTTIIKAIAACLSAPLTNEIFIELARKIGIIRHESETMEPLVNVGAELAEITIEMDGEKWEYKILKSGKHSYSRKGDERFLLTSVITRGSEVLRRLMAGDVDFGWIARSVSLANRYEKVNMYLDREVEKTNDIIYQINNKKKAIEELKKKMAALENTMKSYKDRENALNKQLRILLKKSGEDEVKRLMEQRDKLIDRINALEKDLDYIKTRINSIKDEIAEENRKHQAEIIEIRRLEKMREKIEEEFKRLTQRKRIINEELKGWGEKLRTISNRMDKLTRDEGKILAKLEMYKRALNLTPKGKRVVCPLCGKGYLSITTLEKHKLITEKKLSELRDKIAELIRERNHFYSLEREKDVIENRLKELRKEEPDKIKKQLQRLKARLAGYEARVNKLNKYLLEWEQKYKDRSKTRDKCRKELQKIENKLKRQGRKQQTIISKLAMIRGKISEVEKQLEHLRIEIRNESTVNINGYSLPVETAEKITNSWIHLLGNIKDIMNQRIMRERIMAIDLFNKQIKKVLNDSGFKYLDVWVDTNNYKLHIIDKRIGKEISPRILSETERYILAFVIHVALKLAYTPHLPFLLIDEVALSFDAVRRRASLEYLLNLAKQNDWIVIVTELGRESKITITPLTSY